MQFSAAAALLVLATTAVAFPRIPSNSRRQAPSQPHFAFINGNTTVPAPPATGDGACSPGTYQCNDDLSGWLVCDTVSELVSGGDCTDGTTCQITSGQPYCL